jgi:hypothetical protein
VFVKFDYAPNFAPLKGECSIGLETEPIFDNLCPLKCSGYSITEAIDYLGERIDPRLADSGRLFLKLSFIMMF